MIEPSNEDLRTVAQLASRQPELELLVLHGSRSRGEAHELSDWDFAYLGGPGFDPDSLLSELSTALRADRIDLVDLGRVGALLRHRVARDGVCLFERRPKTFERFRVEAATTWCDLAPVLEPEYERVLERLHR